MKKLIFVICIVLNVSTVRAQQDSRVMTYETSYGTFEVERVKAPTCCFYPEEDFDHLYYVLNGKRWEINHPSSLHGWCGLITSIEEGIDQGVLVIVTSYGVTWVLVFIGPNYGWRVFRDSQLQNHDDTDGPRPLAPIDTQKDFSKKKQKIVLRK